MTPWKIEIEEWRLKGANIITKNNKIIKRIFIRNRWENMLEIIIGEVSKGYKNNL